ncbi:MAG: hypothetical protein Q8W45_00745 [Candidatus Palauibacterales bacterium]|nr:hypothetical protein [Candidatus Palauibacterales bacterium]
MKGPRWLGRSPLRLGLTISCVLLLGLIASEALLDRWPAIARAAQGGPLSRQDDGILRDLRIAVVHCLLAGYLPAAFLSVLRSGRETVIALQRALDCTPKECDALANSVRLSATGLAVAALVGITLAFAAPYIVPPVPVSPWRPLSWAPEVAWTRILGLWLGACGAMLAYAIASVSRRMSRLATDLKSIDLFDLEPLLPFTRQGLRNALLLIGFVAISGLMLLTETGFGLLGTVVGTSTLVIAGLALLLPLRGVHRRITEAKEVELAWVNSKLREQRDVLKKGSARTSGDLSDLSAYRELIRGVRDWPISTSSYVRFAAYLLIPLISWAAAGLVERLVDALVF